MAEEDMNDESIGVALSLFESSDTINAFGNNDNHVHHQVSIDDDCTVLGQDHFIIDEPNNNNYDQQEYDNEDEENPPHVPTGSSSHAFQLTLIRKEIMEAKSTAVKAIKIAIEAKKETKETIKVLEETKKKLSDSIVIWWLGNNFSNNNNNNMLLGGENNNNSNGNRNTPQFCTINSLPNDDRQSQTASLSADTYTLMPVTGISVLVQLVKVQLKVELLFSAKIMWLGMILGHLRLENGGCI